MPLMSDGPNCAVWPFWIAEAIGRPKGANYDRKAIRAALLTGASARVVRETGASIGTTAAVRKKLVEGGVRSPR